MRFVKKYIGYFIIVVLTCITGYYLFKEQNFSDVWQIIVHINPIYIVLCFICMFAFVSCEAMASRTILKSLGYKLSFTQCLGYSFSGFYFSSVTPSSTGGQPAQVFFMQKDGIKIPHGTLDMIVITITYQVATLIWGILGIFTMNLVFLDETIRILLIIGIVLTILVTIIIISLLFIPIKNERFLEYRKCAKLIRENPIIFVKSLFFSLLQLLCLYIIPYIIYNGFGLTEYSFFQIISTQAVINLAIAILPIPGLVGIAEASFISIFTAIFGEKLVISAMILNRGISFYAFLLISGIVSLVLYIIKNKKTKICV